MSLDKVIQLLECVQKKTTFTYSSVRRHPHAFNLFTDIDLHGERQRISISITYYPENDYVILFLYISQGFYGNKANLIDQLLLRLNATLQVGSFAVWEDNGDIVYRREVDIRTTTCARLCSILENTLGVYIITKPTIDRIKESWNLRYLTDSEARQIAANLSGQLRGLSEDLRFLE